MIKYFAVSKTSCLPRTFRLTKIETTYTNTRIIGPFKPTDSLSLIGYASFGNDENFVLASLFGTSNQL